MSVQEPTWACQQWRWPCAPGGEMQTLAEADADSRRRRDIQSPRVPNGNRRADTTRSPAGGQWQGACAWKIGVWWRREGRLGGGADFFPTSVPEPGRKFLTVMVLPGAGKGASMIPLMKGCTRAGEMALLFSTSSRIWRQGHMLQKHKV